MYDVIVSIVTYKQKHHLERCLETLFEDAQKSGLNFRVAIVDNASFDDVASVVNKFPHIDFLKNDRNVGFGKSHNRIMGNYPEAKYYFILNADTVFPQEQNLLKALYDFMEQNPKIGITGPKLLYPDGSLQYSCCRFPNFLQPLYSRTRFGATPRGTRVNNHFLMKQWNHNQTIPVDWIIGSAMFARKTAIDAVGKFDERFWMYAEDSDWCRSMWQNGWYVYYLPTIFLYHVHERSSAKIPGVWKAIFTNHYARVHIKSWIKYFWKWRNTHIHYAQKP